ncbi:MAG: sigma-70 family RNA polymerase sigma factor [Tahibacter sp.]
MIERSESVSAQQLEELVRRLVARDQAALGQLYDLTVDRVYTIALRVLGDPQDAEEAVADVYAQVWETAARFDSSRGGVMAWLIMQSHSRSIDRRRRRGEPASMLHGDEAELALSLQPNEGAGPQDLVDLLQHGGALRAALSGLTPIPRGLIGLAFLQDLSHQEIAEQTGIPLGTVKSHIRRGLNQLREALERRGIDAA